MSAKSESTNKKWYQRMFNKYVLVVLVFAVVMIFVGENSLINRVRYGQKIRQLEAEKLKYERLAGETEEKIRLLESDEELEKLAREEFQMKRDSEVVYIVDEE